MFRTGTAPIKVETGRYQNLDLSERFASIVPLALKMKSMY